MKYAVNKRAVYVSNRSRRHDSLVISTSDIHPVYKDETKVTAPCGAIPMRYLKVFQINISKHQSYY
jgi:hypothetical protein